MNPPYSPQCATFARFATSTLSVGMRNPCPTSRSLATAPAANLAPRTRRAAAAHPANKPASKSVNIHSRCHRKLLAAVPGVAAAAKRVSPLKEHPSSHPALSWTSCMRTS
ncbi:hypothetical protein VTO73DRAFT_14080 [Trametes versicolor]